MITPPAGWTQHFGAHLVTLYPPEGGGRIRFYERIRPVRPASEIVRMVLANEPAFRVTGVQDPQDVVTAEGEYGAWVRVNGTRDGRPAVHLVGIVFTDEFACALDTLVVLRDRLSALEVVSRELLTGIKLGLGTRRRRFRYEPPVGWQPLASGLVANWYPMDFPRNNTNLVVFAAEPFSAPPESVEALLSQETARGFTLLGTLEDTAFTSHSGLGGRLWRFHGRRGNKPETLYRDFVTLSDDTYRYSMRMETYEAARVDEHRALFEAVAQSTIPIPAPGAPRIGAPASERGVETFMHWTD